LATNRNFPAESVAIPIGVGPAGVMVPATLSVPSLFTVYADIPPGEEGAELPLFTINTASALGVMSIEEGALPVGTALPFKLSEPLLRLIVYA